MVHQYQLNGYNIVLDTCSGSIHVVDEVAYDIIALFEDHAPEEIVSAMLEKYRGRPDVTEEDLRACLEDVQAFKDAGKLFSPDTFAGMAGTFKERSGGRGEGAVPPRGPHLQPQLRLLLRKPGEVPRGAGSDEL